MGLSRVELGNCFSGNALQKASWAGLEADAMHAQTGHRTDSLEAAAVRRTLCRGRGRTHGA